MHCDILNVARRRGAVLGARGLLIAGLAAALAGCNTTTALDTTGSIPGPYRERHPIALKEGKKTLVLFVGTGRGGLSPMQRAEVPPLPRTDVTPPRRHRRPVRSAAPTTAPPMIPEGSAPDHRAGRRAQQRSSGGPYNPGERTATCGLISRLMVADAGPCGLCARRSRPSTTPSTWIDSTTTRLRDAAQSGSMAAEPADIVQPRAEGPAYTAKRTFGIDKWRKGDSPATTYPDGTKGAISDVGK